ncbi:MAG: preprotein translocase subunit YajC [Planctomycetota bacterium]
MIVLEASPLILSVGAVLAQAEGAGGGGSPFSAMAPIAMMALLAYFIFVAPQRAKDKRYAQMIEALKENDHVVTTGGMHGVITGLNRDAGHATLRIDDAAGTKVRVALWAIDSVKGDAKSDKES